jgi:hypothetical protein
MVVFTIHLCEDGSIITIEYNLKYSVQNVIHAIAFLLQHIENARLFDSLCKVIKVVPELAAEDLFRSAVLFTNSSFHALAYLTCTSDHCV